MQPGAEDRSDGRWGSALAAAAFVGCVGAIAGIHGAELVFFPELGALAYETLREPDGRWARAPWHLALMPVLTGVLGILVSRALPLSAGSVALVVAPSVALLLALRSPISPALSAGLLPLVLGVRDPRYPALIGVGTGGLALIAVLRERLFPRARAPLPPPVPALRGWGAPFAAFVLFAAVIAQRTGVRYVLFPPVVVLAFELFRRGARCPWSAPWRFPAACFLTALAGYWLHREIGTPALSALTSMAAGIAVLKVLRTEVPPALAVGLLPIAIGSPPPLYPFAVGASCAALSALGVAVRRLSARPAPALSDPSRG